MASVDDHAEVPAVREPGLPLILRRLLPGAVVATITIFLLRPLSDPDTPWHILAGQRLLATGDFVQADPYSPATTAPWILHQWLPETAMALLERTFGVAGVAWGFTAVFACIGTALWWTLRRRAGLIVTSLIILVTTFGISASLSARPQIVSFLLIVVVTDAWLRTAHDGSARWWLLPLSWVWASSHGLWVVGPVVGIVVITGLALGRAHSGRHLARLAVIPLGSILVALLTPLGTTLFTSFADIRAVAPLIDEWQPIPPTHQAFIAAGLLVAFPLLIAVRSRELVPWPQVLILVLATGCILMYSRTVAVGAALAAPIAAVAMQRASGIRRERVKKAEVVLTLAVVSSALVVTAVLAPRRAAEFGDGATELGAALESLPAGTIVCNDESVGGWLLWEHPDLRPTLDTRMEVYGAEHVRAHINFIRARPDWQDYLANTGCTAALLPTEAPVHRALIDRGGWREIDHGDTYVLLEARSAS